MTRPFEELVALARHPATASNALSRAECLEATRAFVGARRQEILRLHRAGQSGTNVVRMLSDMADTVLRGVLYFGVRSLPGSGGPGGPLLSRVALCALGGYGRRELSPYSDIDVCLLFEGAMDDYVEGLNGYLVPFLWDAGFVAGYAVRSVDEAIALVREDIKVFTSFLEARLLVGDGTVFARMRLSMREFQAGRLGAAFVEHKVRDRYEELPEAYRDMYQPEPNIKENAGGLRDFHTALWLLMMAYGADTLDDAVAQELITPEEQLEFVDGLDFLWRIRNELHFRAGKADDRLTFANQRHVARSLGYGEGSEHDALAELMQDYYAAASKLRRFLRIAARICHYPMSPVRPEARGAAPGSHALSSAPEWVLENGFLHTRGNGANRFAHNPARLMEAFWRCARDLAQLSR
ncbi:MAG: hypothetical protein JXR94_24295, partial [Candidatus Hydrogenedentes bacterium]|nr:hypothetical protein [Candidatus Hydrogenedentota bacterium]